MKRFAPYIFPLVVVLIVFFLVFRWYSNRAQMTPDVGEGISIENLSEEELKNAISGVGDYATVQLEDVTPSETPSDSMMEGSDTPALTGVVRYEIDGDRVKMSVIGQAGDPNASYYVWLQPNGATSPKQAFMLEMNKGGLVGSGALSVDQLPLDVLVTKGDTLGDSMQNVVLRGRVEAKAAE